MKNIAVALLAFLFTGVVHAQAMNGPVDDSALSWDPPKWGRGDRAGSANHTKNPANVAKALDTIKKNTTITLGKY